MPDTIVGLFKNRTEADQALGKLEDAGFNPDDMVVATRHSAHQAHYGRKVLLGIGGGAIVGAIAGAFLTGMIPDTHAVIAGDKAALFGLILFAGLGAGGLVGALLAIATSGAENLYYDEEVASGRTVITVSGPRLAQARDLMLASGAMESAPVEAPLKRPRPESG